MPDMIAFDFAGAPVRVLHCSEAGEALFNAADVATALGYARPRDAVAAHCKGAVKRRTPTAGGVQEVVMIPERDVYRLAMRSRLPSAAAFEEWVVATVLPSIRQHGGYIAGQETIDDPQLLLARALQVAERVIAAKDQALAQQQQTIAAQQPAVDYWQAVASSGDAVGVGELGRLLGVGQNRLFALLRRRGILQASNEPYQRYIDRGYFRVVQRTWQAPDGRMHVTARTVVTGLGQGFVQRLVDKDRACAVVAHEKNTLESTTCTHKGNGA